MLMPTVILVFDIIISQPCCNLRISLNYLFDKLNQSKGSVEEDNGKLILPGYLDQSDLVVSYDGNR